jgi:hypothetical protein
LASLRGAHDAFEREHQTAVDRRMNTMQNLRMAGVGDVGSNERTAIQQLVDRLKQKYPAIPPDTVTTVVHCNHARFDGRPVRDFVPLFVERGSRLELGRLSG